MLRVGLISDTHGLLRPRRARSSRVAIIHHGGDLCDGGMLEALSAIAPVTAVRGNNDRWRGRRASARPDRCQSVESSLRDHDLAQLAMDPMPRRSGHRVRPSQSRRSSGGNGILYVNPGAPSGRFKMPISVGELTVTGGSVSARIVGLDSAGYAQG